MAKQSVIEARKAQALTDQSVAMADLVDQVAKLEAKIDRLIEMAEKWDTAPGTESTKKGVRGEK